MRRRDRGALSIEAAITYPIFLMVIVTILYIMRIVYTYGLIQHAAAQTVKELSMYTYIYQVSGLSELSGDLRGATAGRTDQFNSDVGSVVELYNDLMGGNVGGALSAGNSVTTNPEDVLKNVGAFLVGGAAREANQQLFEAVVRPLMAGYIGADSQGASADERLRKLRVTDGIGGLNLDASSFCEDGVTIDLVVCYTIDPIFPIDIMPSLNLMNRAKARGMNGKTVWKPSGGNTEDHEESQSVWDNPNSLERGKIIQEQDGARNLPENFPTYSAFDPSTGTATATVSIDLTMSGYQDAAKIRNSLNSKCNKILNYKTASRDGVTVDSEDIRKNVLIVYIPSSTEDRRVDKTAYNQALADIRNRYPDIQIVTKEID